MAIELVRSFNSMHFNMLPPRQENRKKKFFASLPTEKKV